MQLGFVSALFSEWSLEEVFAFAADEGFSCVELMCWPRGDADRRYAGVNHLDVVNLDDAMVGRVQALVRSSGVAISGLGYYPNPLDHDSSHRHVVIQHLHQVITAAHRLDVSVVNTFVGRDHTKSVEANWPVFLEIWPAIVRHAEVEHVRLGLENCPMLFSGNEWPGGKNLMTTPEIWSKVFDALASGHVGLNFDPSHLVWQHIDYVRCIREFGARVFHVHAKDTRIDADTLYRYGSSGMGWHTAKLPGLGDVNWGQLFSALTDAKYRGAVCIEVEDQAFEGSLDDRKRALRQSKRYLEQFVS